MSNFSAGNPNTNVFRDFSPGPHTGTDPDPETRVAPDSIDSRARNALTPGAAQPRPRVLTGIPAIWVGRKALIHLATADGALKGRWAAWTGIALGCVGVALTVGAWIYLHNN